MWTPKRILILLGGLALFLGAYSVYAYFLGGIDSLSVLPAEYLRRDDGPFEPTFHSENESDITTKLKLAFGAGCPELSRKIKINLPSKGLCLAAEQFDIEKSDGRVKLFPFSAAVFKDKDNGKTIGIPEINTVQCAYAFLTLDQPVANLMDLSNRKIVRVELVGSPEILMTNNNRTLEKGDDIEAYVTEGPMFYDEPQNKIWTDGIVRLEDRKTQPHPTKIIGRGMELKLAEGTGPNRPSKAPPAPKPKEEKARATDKPSGLEMVTLKSNVSMYLYLEPGSGFLGPQTDPAKEKQAAARGEVTEKSEVVIKTSGPFHYDLKNELAWFDVATLEGAAKPTSPDQVEVTRKNKGMKFDQLFCDHLKLHIRKKTDNDPKKPKDPKSVDSDIDWALATARGPQGLTMVLDTEDLVAYGAELQYHSATAERGAKSILKGSDQTPMKAIKKGHEIQAKELHLIGEDSKGKGQQAYAKGPGRIDLFDEANPKNEHPNYAKWRDSLTIVKDPDGEIIRDLIQLNGDASFVDQVHDQNIAGQVLKVWLDPSPQSGQAAKKRDLDATMAAKQQMHKIEAFEKVSARLTQFIVHQTDHLLIHFKNEPAAGNLLPAVVPGNSAQAPLLKSGPDVAKNNLILPLAPAGKQNQQAQGNNKKPVELWANDVVAYVTSYGEERVLQRLVTNGSVHVLQEGEAPSKKKTQDKGMDIKGELLELTRYPRGNILFVYGDPRFSDIRKFAQLQLGELHIYGPKVKIDQQDNNAEVEGAGAMTLPPSDKTFDGGKAAKANSRLTIHWKKDMFFDGKIAEFRGNVTADQDDAKMMCENLQVILDRVVSFKEGEKDNQKPNVERLICDLRVWVEDTKFDPQGKRSQFERLRAHQLVTENKQGPTVATGPGLVEHLALSSGDDPLQAPSPQRPKVNAPRKDEAMKLTRIRFDNRMFSNNTDNSRTTFFYTNVEVFHFPTEDPDAKMNPDNPPKDGFYMNCQILEVYTRQINNKSSQLMVAKQNVTFRTQDIYGRAAVVKYDESQDKIIFEGVPGSPAVLNRLLPGRPEPQVIRGSIITYNRKKGEFEGGGGQTISVPN